MGKIKLYAVRVGRTPGIYTSWDECCAEVNGYSKPIYSVSSTLLIRDDSNSQLGAENLLEGLEIFSGRTNLKNEIALLNSYSITKQVVEELGFGTSYFRHGKILTSVLYDNLPFFVSVDSTHLQLCSREFFVTILNTQNIEFFKKIYF